MTFTVIYYNYCYYVKLHLMMSYHKVIHCILSQISICDYLLQVNEK